MTLAFLWKIPASIITLVFWGILCPPSKAYATTLDDYLAAGFSVERIATLPVSFTGCQRNETVNLDEGSRFLCRQRIVADSYNSKVYFLRQDSGPPTVMLIGDIACPCSLLQFGTHIYAALAPLDSGALPQLARPDDPFATGLTGVEPIRSINELQMDASHRLNDAQSRPLAGSAPPSGNPRSP